MSKATVEVRGRLAEFLLILAAASVVAVLVRYLADRKVVPESYVLPIYVVIILVGGYMAIRIVERILDRVAAPALGATRTRGVKNVFQISAWILLVLAVTALFGVNLTAALVGAGFLGIVLGLAAQQVLGNIFAGLSLFVSKPFEIGDRVTLATSSYGLTGSTYSHESEVAGFSGVVQDVGLLYTHVLLDNGTPAVFPNSVVIGALIINHARVSLRTIRVRMDLDKKVDYNRFRSLLMENLKKHDILELDKSQVQIVDLGATTYQVVVEVWARSKFEEPIKTLVIQEGMKARSELSGA